MHPHEQLFDITLKESIEPGFIVVRDAKEALAKHFALDGRAA